MIFDIGLGMARRLLMTRPKEDGGVSVLDLLAEKLAFEVAVGANGRIWIKSGSVRETLTVGRAVQGTDEGRLDLEGQKKLVARLLRDF